MASFAHGVHKGTAAVRQSGTCVPRVRCARARGCADDISTIGRRKSVKVSVCTKISSSDNTENLFH